MHNQNTWRDVGESLSPQELVPWTDKLTKIKFYERALLRASILGDTPMVHRIIEILNIIGE